MNFLEKIFFRKKIIDGGNYELLMDESYEYGNNELYFYEKPMVILDKNGAIVSWSVIWFTKTGWNDMTKKSAKVFVSREAAIKFRTKIKEAATFLDCWVSVSIEKNK